MVDFELGPECRPELFEVYLGILPGPFLSPPWAQSGPGPGAGAWDLVGPRAQAGPGLSKKHDSTVKMKRFDPKGTILQ